MKIVVLIRNFRTIPPIIHLCRLLSHLWQFNVCPAGDIALTVFVLPPPQPRFHPLSSPQYDSSRHKFHNICPARYITLTVFIPSYGNYSSICFQANCAAISCTDRHDIRPIRNVAFPRAISPHGNYSSICFQTDYVVAQLIF